MSLIETVLLSLALAVDAFSVGAAVGLLHRKKRQLFRLAFHFGLFQSLFAMVGAFTGIYILRFFADVDHWLILVILAFLGIRMVINGAKGEEPNGRTVDPTRGWTMVGLSSAVSIDALAAGVFLPTATIGTAMAVVLIGVVAGLATLTAMLLANRIGRIIGRRAEIVAGLVLIGIGIKTVLTHIL